MRHEAKSNFGAMSTQIQSRDGAPRRGNGRTTRRQLLRQTAAAVLISSAAMPEVIGSHQKPKREKGRKHWPKPPKGVRKPRFRRHKKKDSAYSAKLLPGFYKNPRSQVVHYVGTNQKIALVKKINGNRLLPVQAGEVIKLPASGSKTRVKLSAASHAIEQAALASLDGKDHATACQLLISAIKHDEMFKKDTREYPSLRLYDLLAGVSLRSGQQQHFDELIRLAKSTQQRLKRPATPTQDGKGPPQATRKPAQSSRPHRKWKKEQKLKRKAIAVIQKTLGLDARIKKWTAADSPWRRRWRDTNRPLPWKQRTT